MESQHRTTFSLSVQPRTHRLTGLDAEGSRCNDRTSAAERTVGVPHLPLGHMAAFILGAIPAHDAGRAEAF